MSQEQSGRIVENLGRDWLVNELQRAGIEAALTDDNRFVDLIAFPAPASSGRTMPIQMVSASRRKFAVIRKYSEIADLLMVYIWNLQTEEPVEAYAMTYNESVEIAQKMEWTKTVSWRRGMYFTSKPSNRLLAFLEPYRMTTLKWQEIIKR